MGRVRYQPFCIYLNEIRWSGAWYLEGKELGVMSAYGGASRPLGRRKPERLAEALLLEILSAKLSELEGR